MLKAEVQPRIRRPEFLSRLRRYSASEVITNNTYRQLFARMPSWKSWVEDTLEELLQVPGGSELHVTLVNDLDSEHTRSFVFTQKEMSVGRGADNDISLHLQSISRRHARIFERKGDYFIEDLHSAAGTYVNRRKLDPDHPCQLRAGDEVLIFPYMLKVTPRDLWARDENVRLTCSSELTSLDSAEFAAGFGADTCVFEVGVHPQMGHLLLAMSRPLAETIIARLLRGAETNLVESDQELLEFVTACVLERANRALQFPFECSLSPLRREADRSQTGLKLETFVRLSEAHGCIRLFLPGSFLEQSPKRQKSFPDWMKTALRWRLSLRIGFAEIEAAELGQTEAGDILVYTARCELLLPSAPHSDTHERGWRVVRDEADASRYVVEHFHEWSHAMPEEQVQGEAHQETASADLTALPVRVHVVLGHVDMDLKALESLTEGSIVELDGDNRGTVQLVTGETVLGAGELVELEDHRLGVQITRWREK